MSKRFGGQYSPNTATHASPLLNPAKPPKPARVGFQANMMILPPSFMLVISIFSGASAMIIGLVTASLWYFGVYMLREGIKAQSAYEARRVTRRPALPRKTIAAICAASGAGLAAWNADATMISALFYALAAAALHLFTFGIDPMSDKGMNDVDALQSGRVARILDEAEAYLTTMREAALSLRDRHITVRVDQFQAVVHDMARTVEEDPRDLTAARKYLTVYLQGARDATVKFADIFARDHDQQARNDYLLLLDDLEQNFTSKHQKLLDADRNDLTIEIEVLRERLQREGVHLDRSV